MANINHCSFLFKVYQADTVQYLCKDKYYGRKLSLDGFRHAIYHFFHNGKHLRTDLVEPIVSQLKALLSVIKKQNTYRFYSSSLLINYEGLEKTLPFDNYPQVDVRMIDFAHTTYKGARCNQTVYDGPDHGYIFGLENLIKIIQNIPVGE